MQHSPTQVKSALRRAGFKYDSGDQVQLFVRFERRGNSIVGNARIVSPKFSMRIEASFDMTEAQIHAMALMLPRLKGEALAEGIEGVEELVGRRRRRRRSPRRRSRFRKFIHRLSTRLAKSKIMNKLRGLRAKLLRSPLAKLGIKAAAGALNAFGVPRSVTTMVLNQARATTIDRMQKGGFAGQMSRATAKGQRRGGFFREEGRRQLAAMPGSLMSALPGGRLGAKMLKGLTKGKKLGKLGGFLSKFKIGDEAPGWYHGAVGYEGLYSRGWHNY